MLTKIYIILAIAVLTLTIVDIVSRLFGYAYMFRWMKRNKLDIQLKD